MQKNRISFSGKVSKGLAAIAILFGLIGATTIKLSIKDVVSTVVAVISLAAYWHIVEILYDKICDTKSYFVELQEDVKYIRNNIKGV